MDLEAAVTCFTVAFREKAVCDRWLRRDCNAQANVAEINLNFRSTEVSNPTPPYSCTADWTACHGHPLGCAEIGERFHLGLCSFGKTPSRNFPPSETRT